MLTIRWETDYAFLILHYIAKQKRRVSAAELVREVKVPRQFTAQIAAKLVKREILESKEGKSGGYLLTRSLKDISVYEVISTFERDLHVVSCQKNGFLCPMEDNCSHRTFFRTRFTAFLSGELKKWTLEDIYRTSRS